VQSRMLVTALTVDLLFSSMVQAQDTNQMVLRLVGEIDALKAEIEPLKALLQGAVVAFDRSQARGACPQGWQLYQPAGGRFIVGAGTNTHKDMNGKDLTDYSSFKDDPLKAVSGEEMQVLTEVELPAHRHGVYRHAAERSPSSGLQGAGSADTNPPSNVRDGWESGSAGGNQPHNIMPPFVALYYCIKE
jgi:microcystin-dependent protein